MSREGFAPLVSVIVIDYKRNNPYLIECLTNIGEQSYKKYEIILESDHEIKLNFPNLKVVHYNGKYIPPAKKRDHGAQIAKGEILAFIDDDAYPDKDWLKNLVKPFVSHEVVGVGGPGITPPNVTWQEEASGWASASPIGAGPYTYRFIPGEKQFVEDFPSMNLAVRKKDFQKVGGYDSNYWPGEDTKLCLDLTYKLHKKIVYEPKAIVYHHRRPIFLGHLKQNGSFGLHRGYFAKRLPETSLKLIYFAPSILLLGFVLLPVLFFVPLSLFNLLLKIDLIFVSIYLIALVVNAIWIYLKSKNLYQSIISILVISVTHLWYGVRFLQGLIFTDKLNR